LRSSDLFDRYRPLAGYISGGGEVWLRHPEAMRVLDECEAERIVFTVDKEWTRGSACEDIACMNERMNAVHARARCPQTLWAISRVEHEGIA
jgi:hypothetical protein